MKTKSKTRKMNVSKRNFAVVVALMVVMTGLFAQDQENKQTLFSPDIKVTELWTPEVKVNSIQGNVGTLVGFYGGALINRTFLIGIAGGVNLTHPRVNYGYFGAIGQVIFKADKVVHFSGQLVLALGNTKDYEDPKEGLFDNFWNISGEDFYMIEPGVNVEVNMSNRLTLVAGVSYRHVTGLNTNNENVSITHVTNEDMSGFNFNIGLKFGKKSK